MKLNFFKFLLLFVFIPLSLNIFNPNEKNAKLINEYDIVCDPGNITYEINITKTKKYLHLIKDTYIKEFILYDEKYNEIPYVSNSEYDFFYRIDSKDKLYLVKNHALAYCLSFQYSNNSSIIFIPNEIYKYPIISNMGGQYFKTKIENLAKRHFIFYFRYPPDANSGSYYNYELYIDNDRVFHRTDKFVFSMILTKKEIDAKIILPTGRLIANLTYMSIPYSNITDDVLICNDDSENIKSFLIKKPKTDFTYIWYSLSSDKIHFYKDNAYTSTLKESFKAVWNEYEYFVLMKDKGCFQIKYLNIYQSIIIYKKDTLIISTTSIYNLIYEDTAQTFFNITLYSKENNFIEKIRIQNYGPTLDIKKDRNNLYYYEFAYSSNYEGRIYFDIYFNLTQKDYILVEFDIRNNLTPEKLIINIKEEQNKNIKDIGNNGTLEIITDYNDTETYIFSNSDIESYTFNNTMIDKDNNYIYNVICRLWKCNKGRIKIFCKFYEDLKYETKNLIFSNTTYSYRKYTFNIINYCIISINKINGNIPFIYSEDQIIDIDSGYILYFKFKYDLYSKEKLFLFDNKFKSAYFEKCTTKPIKREIDCQISNEKLKSILSFSGENFFFSKF